MEDLVTYEQAVKLKELGFDWECNQYYWNKDLSYIDTQAQVNRNVNGWGRDNKFSAPTLSQVAKWLREVHNLYVSVFIDINEGINPYYIWDYELRDIKTGDYKGSELGFFATYEKALSSGINIALEIIKNK